ncbi:MAG TPA: hypothetical protein VLG50_07190 [Candidatus Saccharimonadales bacterium]|nr:hypothetical protein [Candidatus Saccharimonadales bacterium]
MKQCHDCNLSTNLTWQNGYEKWSFVKFNVPDDGHCLFHALFLAYYKPYISAKTMARTEIIMTLRHELAHKLSHFVPGTKHRYYDVLNHGKMADYAKAVPEFSLKKMQATLNSNNDIGYGYFEYIGNQLNKDIFILDGDRQDLYQTDEYKLSIKHNRPAIVLYYQNRHYQLIGVKDDKDNIITHFKPNNELIQFLKNRIHF